jgi:hypothetical protein
MKSGPGLFQEIGVASGESNVFRLSRNDVNGLLYIMMTPDLQVSEKDF